MKNKKFLKIERFQNARVIGMLSLRFQFTDLIIERSSVSFYKKRNLKKGIHLPCKMEREGAARNVVFFLFFLTSAKRFVLLFLFIII